MPPCKWNLTRLTAPVLAMVLTCTSISGAWAYQQPQLGEPQTTLGGLRQNTLLGRSSLFIPPFKTPEAQQSADVKQVINAILVGDSLEAAQDGTAGESYVIGMPVSFNINPSLHLEAPVDQPLIENARAMKHRWGDTLPLEQGLTLYFARQVVAAPPSAQAMIREDGKTHLMLSP